MAVSGGILILLALMILILPLQWVTAIVLAAAFHEWCHILALRFCGAHAGALQIEARGARLRAEGLSRVQELVCSLAGPLGGLFLLVFARWIPRTAVCAGFQSLFNLLPVYPLDGGRLLRCIGLGDRGCIWVENICLAGILLIGAWASFRLHLGLFPFGISLLVLFRAKRPCKATFFSVQ
jgi:hypothetical protein